MDKIVLVSNRLPITLSRRGGSINLQSSVGGLARSLDVIRGRFKVVWVGWPGLPEEDLADMEEELGGKLTEVGLNPVHLPRQEVQNYYYGYCNRTIWPLFHYFPEYTVNEEKFWKSYVRVNERFRKAVEDVVEPGDIVWVHDYHLFLLPKMLRESMPHLPIGFFLHIPFPSSELFRALPQRREILNGMLGSDLVGFHTYRYVRNFMESVRSVLGCEVAVDRVYTGERIVLVDVFPLGIDYDWFSQVIANPKIQREARRVKGRVRGRKIVLSADRLDYTKGIPTRLEAFEKLLEGYEEYRGKVTLVLLVSPSRTGVAEYRRLKEEIDKLVGRINGRFGTLDWMPVWYVYRFLPVENLIAMYRAADVMLVTPYRDGMNLMAKEYLASRRDRGVLILSEMAGAAEELWDAIIVNPHDKRSIAEAIKEALEMSEEEQERRNEKMRERLRRYDVVRWANEFVGRLLDAKSIQREYEVKSLERERNGLLRSYVESDNRLLFLDYDGTLVPFMGRPEESKPDHQLMEMLTGLSEVEGNDVVVISGRDRWTLDEWLGTIDMGLVAEHGAWIKERGGGWRTIAPLKADWKREVRSVMEVFADKTPGSFVEEKDYSLVWHYRMVDSELGMIKAAELKHVLTSLAASKGLQIVENNKVVEVRMAGINKGEAASFWLPKRRWKFILAAGDDSTDEDMFSVMPEHAFTVKVGIGPSRAKYYVDSPWELRRLLGELLLERPKQR